MDDRDARRLKFTIQMHMMLPLITLIVIFVVLLSLRGKQEAVTAPEVPVFSFKSGSNVEAAYIDFLAKYSRTYASKDDH